MKIKTLFNIMLTGALLLAIPACKKGKDDFLYKAEMIPVTLRGYNGSSDVLLVKLDTFKFQSSITTGRFDLTEGYMFPANKDHAKLSITDKSTGKPVLEKELKKGDGPTNINFFYMNGKISDMPEIPVAEEGKIKIAYMFKPTLTNYSGPVDIVLGKYYWTPKVFEELGIIKNVKPYEFSKAVSIPTFSTVGQQYNGQNTIVSFVVHLYKAGTREFYTEGTDYTWHATSSTAPKPASSVAAAKLYIFSETAMGNSIRFNKDLEL